MHILFLCVANSARSQMAEGLAKRIFPNIKISSAGSNPSHVNPLAIQAMELIDIDISKNISQSVDEFKGQNVNYVITLCEDEVCPFFLTNEVTKKLHWPHPDPAGEGESVEGFIKVRDQIESRLLEFKSQILLNK